MLLKKAFVCDLWTGLWCRVHSSQPGIGLVFGWSAGVPAWLTNWSCTEVLISSALGLKQVWEVFANLSVLLVIETLMLWPGFEETLTGFCHVADHNSVPTQQSVRNPVKPPCWATWSPGLLVQMSGVPDLIGKVSLVQFCKGGHLKSVLSISSLLTVRQPAATKHVSTLLLFLCCIIFPFSWNGL